MLIRGRGRLLSQLSSLTNGGICAIILIDRGGEAVSTLEKLKAKFNEKPIPNNISFDEVERLAKSYGCIVVSGGKHSKKVVDVSSGTVIPIPMHGKYVQEAYKKN